MARIRTLDQLHALYDAEPGDAALRKVAH